MAPNSVLYPLQFLGFRYITVEAWQDLPDKLLELRDEMARHPKVKTFLPILEALTKECVAMARGAGH